MAVDSIAISYFLPEGGGPHTLTISPSLDLDAIRTRINEDAHRSTITSVEVSEGNYICFQKLKFKVFGPGAIKLKIFSCSCLTTFKEVFTAAFPDNPSLSVVEFLGEAYPIDNPISSALVGRPFPAPYCEFHAREKDAFVRVWYLTYKEIRTDTFAFDPEITPSQVSARYPTILPVGHETFVFGPDGVRWTEGTIRELSSPNVVVAVLALEGVGDNSIFDAYLEYLAHSGYRSDSVLIGLARSLNVPPIICALKRLIGTIDVAKRDRHDLLLVREGLRAFLSFSLKVSDVRKTFQYLERLFSYFASHKCHETLPMTEDGRWNYSKPFETEALPDVASLSLTGRPIEIVDPSRIWRHFPTLRIMTLTAALSSSHGSSCLGHRLGTPKMVRSKTWKT
jgi:hypothetical protein